MRKHGGPGGPYRDRSGTGPVLGVAAVALLGLTTAACPAPDADRLEGRVIVDGSSTVYPVTEAMAEEFQRAFPVTRVTVGISGTGGGFQRFCTGEPDIVGASRPMTESERELCERHGIAWLELPIAWDGISVVVNPANDWARCMTVEELRRVWQPGSTIQRWNQIRPEWPDLRLILYAPDTDSGTFDYFTEAIMGEARASRPDYTASADDNVLVVGVAGDRSALGYFGHAYYEENRDRLSVVAVDGGDGCVEPGLETIRDGSYRPLSRFMYLYLRESSLERPEVRAFAEFYLESAEELVPEVGYVPLESERYREGLERLPPRAAPVDGGP